MVSLKKMNCSKTTYDNKNQTPFPGVCKTLEIASILREGWYDYGARNYDPQLGMWFNPDPLMEYYSSSSPYNYCLNDPVNNIDPNGMYVSKMHGSHPEGLYSGNSDFTGVSGGGGRWNLGNMTPDIGATVVQHDEEHARKERAKKREYGYNPVTKKYYDKDGEVEFDEVYETLLAQGDGAKTYSDLKDVFYYIRHTGSSNTKSMDELFDLETGTDYPTDKLLNNGVVRFVYYEDKTAVPKTLKYYSPVSGKTFGFRAQDTVQDNFPTSSNITHPYGIRIVGKFGEREPSICGSIYFSDWDTFYNFAKYIYLGK